MLSSEPPRLGRPGRLLIGEFTRRLDAAGHGDLRPAHGMAFQVLKGGGATGTELGERLGVTKQAAGQLVDAGLLRTLNGDGELPPLRPVWH
ncbi:hypothetical protein ACFQ7O_04430 [Streptomyces sp. NPDC056485]|uniref:hypothetical protein n=1 Tax=Streptomyces sp. NPDC056485 TaxID=3345834 RepID=UPI0036C99E71